MSEQPETMQGNDDVVDPALSSDPGFENQALDDREMASDEVVESLRELVTFLIEHLVDEPQSVETTLDRRNGAVHVQLRMPEEELGKVIGRGGRIAKAIRTVLLIAGSRHNIRVTLDIEG